MDLKTLKTFQLIVKYGSFNRAAEEMNYAQSTVTMQMQKLESDLGVQLIERGKKLGLTEAGRLFYEQCVQIVNQMEQVQADMAALQSGEAGSIRLGVTEPTASCRLPAVLSGFSSRYPKIRLTVDVASTPVLSERLDSGELDLALCSTPEISSGLFFEPLFREPFAVIMPHNHPLALQDAVSPLDMTEHRLLITAATCPYRRKLETVLRELGHTRLETMEIGSMAALPYFVAAGLGIALVPTIALQPAPAGTTVRPLQGDPIDMLFGILSKPSASSSNRACMKFYRYLKQELSDDPNV
ncbi:LysR family transcriptional regulator [Paenibacillus thalictri]|uniref:LysR family transcriptional regulator n=1 Tax=Paenibacillus thalictri TaxID=2527873 RepID=A0A4Q9DLA7_9BACL|nr:LysR family transcriptional regulator [Paenibacillus thalictri]TBL75751.1 LysR family transcriptional regulator [Paenibacillus thalictri]